LIKKNLDTNNWITLQGENWKIESTPRSGAGIPSKLGYVPRRGKTKKN
jgi:hypothetical protein